MPTTQDLLEEAKALLKQHNLLPITLAEMETRHHETSLGHCAKAIELLESAGVCDGELSKWRASIEEHGRCNIRTEDIIARIETHLPTMALPISLGIKS